MGVLSATVLIGIGSNSMAVEAQPQLAATNSVNEVGPELELPKSTIWQNGVGNGFLSSAQDFSAEVGISMGMKAFGSQQAHDFALMSLSYGHMLSGILGAGHWYGGNFEGRLELWGGGQYSPESEWVIGLTPHLRYNFATGTRWIPFLDIGAGVTATGIGPPDLSNTFEFNLQAVTGVRWFVRDDLAVTGEVRYMHLSCAGIHQPNLGINNVAFFLGMTWFFGK
jgi:lipid A 3-O-deacylase